MGKYGKYICTELKKSAELPGYRDDQKDSGKPRFFEHIGWLDNEVIPGAYYTEAIWYWPQGMKGMPVLTPEEAKKRQGGPPPHSHAFPEVLSFCGTNMDDPSDLGGIVEFWLEDEKYIFDKSFIIYIPENVMHCPLRTLKIERPMFHFTMGPGEMYVKI